MVTRLSIALCLGCMTISQTAAQTKPPTAPPAAPARKPAEIVQSIAFLMRIADSACMGVAYDPTPMVKRADPKAASLMQLRTKYRDEFQRAYDEAGARIAAQGLGSYCDFVIGSFASKPKEYPGLVIR